MPLFVLELDVFCHGNNLHGRSEACEEVAIISVLQHALNS
jgi:hypothetical protein